jgi:hypothetical protein
MQFADFISITFVYYLGLIFVTHQAGNGNKKIIKILKANAHR